MDGVRKRCVGAVLAAVAAVALAGCRSAPGPEGSGTTTSAAEVGTRATAPEAALVGAVADRLALAVDVARTKWASGAAIEDLAREAQAVAAIEAAAPGAGVDPAVAAGALRAQIEASKAVQRALHQAWADGAPLPPGEPRDLAAIRTELDLATTGMLAELGRVDLPIPPARAQAHVAALARRLSPVPEPQPAIAQALAPFT